MKGWLGKFLRVNLSTGEVKVTEYDENFARMWLGGRGFAVKILWDEVPKGADPLGPENKLIFATGPLSGLPLPSSGKMVVAAKSPLTGGYGDGNIGTKASEQLKRAGYDALIVEGASDKPVYIYIEDDKVEIKPADHLWGLAVDDLEQKIIEEYGKNIGILSIGPAGENLVKFAVVRSMEGRAGGRPGIGAVMGSKKLKAVVVKGTKEIPLANPEGLKSVGKDSYNAVRKKELYPTWMRQGTMLILEWCQEVSSLPTYNFREGVFEYSKQVDGNMLESMRAKRLGCPLCNMRCGHSIKDKNNDLAELDYENVGMLGPNLGMRDLTEVGTLVRMADDLGMDTICLGGVLAFAAESTEKGYLNALKWNDFERAKELIKDIAYREGELGNLLAEGTVNVSKKLGEETSKWAMHVKGLDTSAYNCHLNPGMALAFGVSEIGAHHKSSWVIYWELQTNRESYGEEKAEKVIELQRIRGGMFECLTTCRFPWIEVGLELDWYPKLLKEATGMNWTLDDMWEIADRVYAMIRAYWVREFDGNWDRTMDYPPRRWFEEPLSEGPLKGAHLDKDKYDQLLSYYYQKRGWDDRGIPTRATLEKFGLKDVTDELEKTVPLN